MSASQNDGVSAFPQAQRLWDSDSQSWSVHSMGGMTLRDYFAGQALSGMITRIDLDALDSVKTFWIAESAYEIADDMLEVKQTIEAEGKKS